MSWRLNKTGASYSVLQNTQKSKTSKQSKCNRLRVFYRDRTRLCLQHLPPPSPRPPAPTPQPPSGFSPLSRKATCSRPDLPESPTDALWVPFLLKASPTPRGCPPDCVGHVTCGRISVSAKPRSEREPASPKSVFTSVWTSRQLKYLWVFGVCAEPGQTTEASVASWMEFVTPRSHSVHSSPYTDTDICPKPSLNAVT